MVSEKRKPSVKRIYTVIASIFIIIGIMVLAGSLLAKNISENKLGDIFNIIFWPLLFFLLPLLFLKYVQKFNIKGGVIFMVTTLAVLFMGLAEFGTTYNYFVQAEENLDKKMDDIALIYERKLAVLPSITIKTEAYNAHEKSIIGKIVEGRSKISGAKTVPEKIEAIHNMDVLARGISVNIENYPNLKSDQFYLEFIHTLKGIEVDVNVLKAGYNTEVNTYNRYSKIFPYVFVARAMDIKQKQYFTKKEE